MAPLHFGALSFNEGDEHDEHVGIENRLIKWEVVEEELFSVMCSVGRENRDSDKKVNRKVEVLGMLIEFVQLIVFPLQPFLFDWSESVWKLWHALSYMTLKNPLVERGLEPFIGAFIVCALAIFYSAIVCFFIHKRLKKMQSLRLMHWAIGLLRRIVFFFFQVFYITTLKIFLVGVSCERGYVLGVDISSSSSSSSSNNSTSSSSSSAATTLSTVIISDSSTTTTSTTTTTTTNTTSAIINNNWYLVDFPTWQCWSFDDERQLGLAAISIIFIILTVVTAFVFTVFVNYEPDLNSRRLLAATRGRDYFLEFFLKTIMVCSDSLVVTEYAKVRAGAFLGGAGIIAYNLLRLVPYYEGWVNVVNFGFYSAMSWCSFLAVVRLFWMSPSFLVTEMSVVMIVGIPVVFLLGCLTMWYRLQSLDGSKKYVRGAAAANAAAGAGAAGGANSKGRRSAEISPITSPFPLSPSNRSININGIITPRGLEPISEHSRFRSIITNVRQMLVLGRRGNRNDSEATNVTMSGNSRNRSMLALAAINRMSSKATTNKKSSDGGNSKSKKEKPSIQALLSNDKKSGVIRKSSGSGRIGAGAGAGAGAALPPSPPSLGVTSPPKGFAEHRRGNSFTITVPTVSATAGVTKLSTVAPAAIPSPSESSASASPPLSPNFGAASVGGSAATTPNASPRSAIGGDFTPKLRSALAEIVVRGEFFNDRHPEVAIRFVRKKLRVANAMNHRIIDAGLAILRQATKEFPDSSKVFLTYGNYLLVYEDRPDMAHVTLDKVQMMHPSFMDRYCLFLRDKERKERLKEENSSNSNNFNHTSVNLAQYIEFQHAYKGVLNLYKATMRSMREFWKIVVSSSDATMSTMSDAFHLIDAFQERTDQAYKNLIIRYPRSGTALKSYGHFLEDIQGDVVGAHRYLLEAEKLEELAAETRRAQIAALEQLEANNNNNNNNNNAAAAAAALGVGGSFSIGDTAATLLKKSNSSVWGGANYFLNGNNISSNKSSTSANNNSSSTKGQSSIHFVFDEKNDATVVANASGEILFVNGVMCRMFGWKKSDILGRNVSVLMPSAIAEQHNRFIHRYVETGKSTLIGSTRKVEAKHRKGNNFTVSVSLSRIDTATGITFMAIFRPVDNKDLCKVTIDAFGIIKACTPPVAKLFGYTDVAELTGHNVQILMEPSINHDEFMKRRRERGEDAHIDFISRRLTARRADGSLFPITLSEMTRKGDFIDSMTFTAVIRDLGADVGVIGINDQGSVMSVSKQAGDLIGWTGSTLIGMNISSIMPPPYASCHNFWMQQYKTTGVGNIIDIGRPVVVMHRDGSLFRVLLTVSVSGSEHRRQYLARLQYSDSDSLEEEALRAGSKIACSVSLDENNMVCQVTGGASKIFDEPLDNRFHGRDFSTLFLEEDLTISAICHAEHIGILATPALSMSGGYGEVCVVLCESLFHDHRETAHHRLSIFSLSSIDVIFGVKKNGEITFANKGALLLLGFSFTGKKKRKIQDLFRDVENSGLSEEMLTRMIDGARAIDKPVTSRRSATAIRAGKDNITVIVEACSCDWRFYNGAQVAVRITAAGKRQIGETWFPPAVDHSLLAGMMFDSHDGGGAGGGGGGGVGAIQRNSSGVSSTSNDSRNSNNSSNNINNIINNNKNHGSSHSTPREAAAILAADGKDSLPASPNVDVFLGGGGGGGDKTAKPAWDLVTTMTDTTDGSSSVNILPSSSAAAATAGATTAAPNSNRLPGFDESSVIDDLAILNSFSTAGGSSSAIPGAIMRSNSDSIQDLVEPFEEDSAGKRPVQVSLFQPAFERDISAFSPRTAFGTSNRESDSPKQNSPRVNQHHQQKHHYHHPSGKLSRRGSQLSVSFDVGPRLEKKTSWMTDELGRRADSNYRGGKDKDRKSYSSDGSSSSSSGGDSTSYSGSGSGSRSTNSRSYSSGSKSRSYSGSRNSNESSGGGGGGGMKNSRRRSFTLVDEDANRGSRPHDFVMGDTPSVRAIDTSRSASLTAAAAATAVVWQSALDDTSDEKREDRRRRGGERGRKGEQGRLFEYSEGAAPTGRGRAELRGRAALEPLRRDEQRRRNRNEDDESSSAYRESVMESPRRGAPNLQRQLLKRRHAENIERERRRRHEEEEEQSEDMRDHERYYQRHQQYHQRGRFSDDDRRAPSSYDHGDDRTRGGGASRNRRFQDGDVDRIRYHSQGSNNSEESNGENRSKKRSYYDVIRPSTTGGEAVMDRNHLPPRRNAPPSSRPSTTGTERRRRHYEEDVISPRKGTFDHSNNNSTTDVGSSDDYNNNHHRRSKDDDRNNKTKKKSVDGRGSENEDGKRKDPAPRQNDNNTSTTRGKLEDHHSESEKSESSSSASSGSSGTTSSSGRVSLGSELGSTGGLLNRNKKLKKVAKVLRLAKFRRIIKSLRWRVWISILIFFAFEVSAFAFLRSTVKQHLLSTDAMVLSGEAAQFVQRIATFVTRGRSSSPAERASFASGMREDAQGLENRMSSLYFGYSLKEDARSMFQDRSIEVTEFVDTLPSSTIRKRQLGLWEFGMEYIHSAEEVAALFERTTSSDSVAAVDLTQHMAWRFIVDNGPENLCFRFLRLGLLIESYWQDETDVIYYYHLILIAVEIGVMLLLWGFVMMPGFNVAFYERLKLFSFFRRIPPGVALRLATAPITVGEDDDEDAEEADDDPEDLIAGQEEEDKAKDAEKKKKEKEKEDQEQAGSDSSTSHEHRHRHHHHHHHRRHRHRGGNHDDDDDVPSPRLQADEGQPMVSRRRHPDLHRMEEGDRGMERENSNHLHSHQDRSAASGNSDQRRAEEVEEQRHRHHHHHHCRDEEEPRRREKKKRRRGIKSQNAIVLKINHALDWLFHESAFAKVMQRIFGKIMEYFLGYRPGDGAATTSDDGGFTSNSNGLIPIGQDRSRLLMTAPMLLVLLLLAANIVLSFFFLDGTTEPSGEITEAEELTFLTLRIHYLSSLLVYEPQTRDTTLPLLNESTTRLWTLHQELRHAGAVRSQEQRSLLYDPGCLRFDSSSCRSQSDAFSAATLQGLDSLVRLYLFEVKAMRQSKEVLTLNNTHWQFIDSVAWTDVYEGVESWGDVRLNELYSLVPRDTLDQTLIFIAVIVSLWIMFLGGYKPFETKTKNDIRRAIIMLSLLPDFLDLQWLVRG